MVKGRMVRNAGLVFFSVLCLVAGNSYAQQGPGQGGQAKAPPSASEMVARMKQALALTDEQVSQITPVIEEEMAQMSALMKQGADPSAGRSQMAVIRKNTQSKLAQYLTVEQLTKMQGDQQKGLQEGSRSGGTSSAESGSSAVSSGTYRSTKGSGIY